MSCGQDRNDFAPSQCLHRASHIRLLQEILLEPMHEGEGLETTGWRMIVGCMMLNQTGRSQVDRVWPAFFRRFPRAQSCIFSGSLYFSEAYAILHPLGFGTRRTQRVHEFSCWWHYDRVIGFDIRDAPGVGQYAEDSWRIFVLGERTIEPDDKELRRYLGWPALQTKQETARRS
jgi:hypothetical protein